MLRAPSSCAFEMCIIVQSVEPPWGANSTALGTNTEKAPSLVTTSLPLTCDADGLPRMILIAKSVHGEADGASVTYYVFTRDSRRVRGRGSNFGHFPFTQQLPNPPKQTLEQHAGWG